MMLITRVTVIEKNHDKAPSTKEQWLEDIEITANGAILPRSIYATQPKASLSKAELLKILQVEDKLRKDAKTIEKFSAEKDTKNFLSLDLEIRKEALQLCGYEPDEDHVKAYGVACSEFYYDSQIRDSVVWLKYEKMKKGSQKVGDAPKTDFEIFDLGAKPRKFSELIAKDIPTIIIAGSLT